MLMIIAHICVVTVRANVDMCAHKPTDQRESAHLSFALQIFKILIRFALLCEHNFRVTFF